MTGPVNKPKEKTDSRLHHRRFVIVCVYYLCMLYLWCTHITYIYVHQGWGTAKDLQNDGKKHAAVNTNIKQKLTFTNCFAQGCMSKLSSSSFIWSQDVLFTGDQAKVHGWHHVPQPTMAVPALTLAELWKNRASVRATWPTKLSDLKTYKVNFEMGLPSLGRCWGMGSPCHSLCELTCRTKNSQGLASDLLVLPQPESLASHQLSHSQRMPENDWRLVDLAPSEALSCLNKRNTRNKLSPWMIPWCSFWEFQRGYVVRFASMSKCTWLIKKVASLQFHFI